MAVGNNQYTPKAQCTPWLKIKKEYLQGVTPKELAVKYDLAASTITNKACKESWLVEKEIISNNIKNVVANEIAEIQSLTLNRIKEQLNRPRKSEINPDGITDSDLNGVIGRANEVNKLKSETLNTPDAINQTVIMGIYQVDNKSI